MTIKLQTIRMDVQSYLNDLLEAYQVHWPWKSQGHFHSSGNFICWLWCHKFAPGEAIDTLTRSGRITSKFYCHRCFLTFGEFKERKMYEHGIFLKWRL